MKKILLIGKNGQVGADLEKQLSKNFTLYSTTRKQLDLKETDKIKEVIKAVKPEVIINATAYTAVDQAELDSKEAFYLNETVPSILAEECIKNSAFLIHYSTDYVFDGKKNTPYNENDKTAPLNVYGRSKLKGEEAIQNSGANFFIFRTSWVYSNQKKNFLQTIIKLADSNKELNIVNDQFGTPTWSRFIAEQTTKILCQANQKNKFQEYLQERKGLYHLTAKGYTNWHELTNFFLKEYAKLFPSKAIPQVYPIPSSEFPQKAKRPQNSKLSIKKISQNFNLELPNWDTCVKEYLKQLSN